MFPATREIGQRADQECLQISYAAPKRGSQKEADWCVLGCYVEARNDPINQPGKVNCEITIDK
jgi:hypothetical protein